MTIKEIAPRLNVQPGSLQKRLKRKGIHFGLNDQLPSDVLNMLVGETSASLTTPSNVDSIKEVPNSAYKAKTEAKPTKKVSIFEVLNSMPKTKAQEKAPPVKFNKLAFFFARLPLAMLGLGASFGVYHFSSHFAPDVFALIVGASFELVYIGIANFKNLNPSQKERASKVAAGAVAVSVVFNIISACMYVCPNWFDFTGDDFFTKITVWTLAIVHGVPMAILNYQYASLVIHSEK